MQSIPILCHRNPVIVHAPREPEPFLLWLQCSLVFLSFLLDVFLWHLTEHWPWARVRAVEGRSSWVGEFPIMSCFTLTTVQDAQRDNHAQLLPWSRLVEKEQLLFHLWQNKRLSNIPVHKLLCKQNTASKQGIIYKENPRGTSSIFLIFTWKCDRFYPQLLKNEIL